MGDQDERDRRGGDLPTWDGGRRAEFDTNYLPKLETVLMATFEKDDENDETVILENDSSVHQQMFSHGYA